jgi:hypothetical protein
MYVCIYIYAFTEFQFLIPEYKSSELQFFCFLPCSVVTYNSLLSVVADMTARGQHETAVLESAFQTRSYLFLEENPGWPVRYSDWLRVGRLRLESRHRQNIFIFSTAVGQALKLPTSC